MKFHCKCINCSGAIERNNRPGKNLLKCYLFWYELFLLDISYYYIRVIFLAEIKASHPGEIHHDGKNPYLHTVKYGSKYDMMTYSRSELLSKFYFYAT